jgi:hypothetical protein
MLMSGSLNALMSPIQGITMPPATNTLAPPTLSGTAAVMAAPTTGATGAPGQAQQPAFTPQQLYALQAMWQQQQAVQAQQTQQQAAQAKALQDQQDYWQANAGHGSEGGGGGAEGTM